MCFASGGLVLSGVTTGPRANKRPCVPIISHLMPTRIVFILMEAFGLAKPYFRRHLKADAVPTVFDQTKLSQPPAPRCKAVKRRAEHDLQEALGVAEPEDDHVESNNQHELSFQAATTTQHSDVREAEPQMRDVYVQTVPHVQKSKAVQTCIKNPSVGVQASPLSVCDSFVQTEDRLAYSEEVPSELRPFCSTPRHDIDAPGLNLYRTDYLSDELSSCDDSDSDIIDYTNDSSYVCDELNDDDSDPEPPVQEMCAEDGVTTKKYIVFESCLMELLKRCRSQQKSVIEEARHQPRSLAGDGRCDTPGHSADFGTYTLLDTELNKIMHTELVKSTEVSSSNKMEKEGLERALDHLIELGLHIDSLVTDRHCEIKAFMRTQHPMICHLFDLWHIAKGLKKKMIALGRLKQHGTVIGWRKTVIRHLYWCAVNSHGNEKLFLARWLSILRHIVNVHDHPDPLHPSCFHGEMPERDWLVEGSESFQRLKAILAAPHLLRDLPRASHKAQTCTILFCDSIYCRTKIAALHYNENSGRDILTDPSGAERISQRFSRGEKEWTVVPVKQNAGYGYISVLLTNVMDCLEKWPSFSTAEQASVRRHHETLSSKYGPKPRKEEARKKQYSRFAPK
ncbi:hypothetical protein HPB49_007767 [Dermacentor silvarum]|uniref:Uncharacterized protein n=1 Tax=Dermacentor silvarum TaxID=543639 RepID=A0ACB8DXE0_DERSI|nr:hypothetical protein HPB49_007767 [Dermacentor silvarum]